MLLLRSALCAAGLLVSACAAEAQDNFISQIIFTGANFCPEYTLEANGAVLQVAEYPFLFSLIDATYGGDGMTTFALPNVKAISQNTASGIVELKPCIVVDGVFPTMP